MFRKISFICLFISLLSISYTAQALEKNFNNGIFSCENNLYYGLSFRYSKDGERYTIGYNEGKYTIYKGLHLIGSYSNIKFDPYYSIVGNNTFGFIEENIEGKYILHFGDFTSNPHDFIKILSVSPDDKYIYYIGFDKNSNTETLFKNELVIDTGDAISEFALSKDGENYGYLKYTGKPSDGNFSLIKNGEVLGKYSGKSHWIDSLGFLKNNSIKFALSDNTFAHMLVINGQGKDDRTDIKNLDVYGNGDIVLKKDITRYKQGTFSDPSKYLFIQYGEKKSEYYDSINNINVSDDMNNIYFVGDNSFVHNFKPLPYKDFDFIGNFSFDTKMEKYAFIGYKGEAMNLKKRNNYIVSSGQISEALGDNVIGPYYSQNLDTFITFDITENSSFSGYTDIDIYSNTQYLGSVLRKGFPTISYSGENFFIEDSIGSGYYSSDKCSIIGEKEKIVSKKQKENLEDTPSKQNTEYKNKDLDSKLEKIFSKIETKYPRSKAIYKYKKIIDSLEKNILKNKSKKDILQYLSTKFKARYLFIIKNK